MAMELQRQPTALERAPSRMPAVPWRDPHTVSPEDLAVTIRNLKEQCALHPDSADLHTCLGMAYAMNYDAYKSMDALEHAVQAEPQHFWAQMKLAELHYRLRCLDRAEDETRRALEIADNPWDLSVARKQLQEIRRLRREGTQKPAWTKPLLAPIGVMALLFILLSVTHLWR